MQIKQRAGELNENMNLSASLSRGRKGQKAFCSRSSEGLTYHSEDHLENYLKQLFPVTILEVTSLVFQTPRVLRRARFLMRLHKFDCIRMFFKELKRKLNIPWQALHCSDYWSYAGLSTISKGHVAPRMRKSWLEEPLGTQRHILTKFQTSKRNLAAAHFKNGSWRCFACYTERSKDRHRAVGVLRRRLATR